jgi:hypothetical protein
MYNAGYNQRTRVPFPTRHRPRYQAVIFQYQILAPYGFGCSTAEERIRRHVSPVADYDVVRRSGAYDESGQAY